MIKIIEDKIFLKINPKIKKEDYNNMNGKDELNEINNNNNYKDKKNMWKRLRFKNK